MNEDETTQSATTDIDSMNNSSSNNEDSTITSTPGTSGATTVITQAPSDPSVVMNESSSKNDKVEESNAAYHNNDKNRDSEETVSPALNPSYDNNDSSIDVENEYQTNATVDVDDGLKDYGGRNMGTDSSITSSAPTSRSPTPNNPLSTSALDKARNTTSTTASTNNNQLLSSPSLPTNLFGASSKVNLHQIESCKKLYMAQHHHQFHATISDQLNSVQIAKINSKDKTNSNNGGDIVDRKMDVMRNELQAQCEVQRRQLDSYRNHVRMKHMRLAELHDKLSDLEALTLKFSFDTSSSSSSAFTSMSSTRTTTPSNKNNSNYNYNSNVIWDARSGMRSAMNAMQQQRRPKSSDNNKPNNSSNGIKENDSYLPPPTPSPSVMAMQDELLTSMMMRIEALADRHGIAAENVMAEVYRGKCYEQIERRVKADLQNMKKRREVLARHVQGVESQLEMIKKDFKKAELAKSKAQINTRNAKQTTNRYRQSLQHRIQDVRRKAKTIAHVQERERRREAREKNEIENMMKRKQKNLQHSAIKEMRSNTYHANSALGDDSDENSSLQMEAQDDNNESRTTNANDNEDNDIAVNFSGPADSELDSNGNADHYNNTVNSEDIDGDYGTNHSIVKEKENGNESDAKIENTNTNNEIDSKIGSSNSLEADSRDRIDKANCTNANRDRIDDTDKAVIHSKTESSDSDTHSKAKHNTNNDMRTTATIDSSNDNSNSNTNNSKSHSMKQRLLQLGAKDVMHLYKKYLEQKDFGLALEEKKIDAMSKVKQLERLLERNKRELLDFRHEGPITRRKKINSLDHQIALSEQRCTKYKTLYGGVEMNLTKVMFGFQAIWDLMRNVFKDLPQLNRLNLDHDNYNSFNSNKNENNSSVNNSSGMNVGNTTTSAHAGNNDNINSNNGNNNDNNNFGNNSSNNNDSGNSHNNDNIGEGMQGGDGDSHSNNTTYNNSSSNNLSNNNQSSAFSENLITIMNMSEQELTNICSLASNMTPMSNNNNSSYIDDKTSNSNDVDINSSIHNFDTSTTNDGTNDNNHNNMESVPSGIASASINTSTNSYNPATNNFIHGTHSHQTHHHSKSHRLSQTSAPLHNIINNKKNTNEQKVSKSRLWGHVSDDRRHDSIITANNPTTTVTVSFATSTSRKNSIDDHDFGFDEDVEDDMREARMMRQKLKGLDVFGNQSGENDEDKRMNKTSGKAKTNKLKSNVNSGIAGSNHNNNIGNVNVSSSSPENTANGNASVQSGSLSTSAVPSSTVDSEISKSKSTTKTASDSTMSNTKATSNIRSGKSTLPSKGNSANRGKSANSATYVAPSAEDVPPKQLSNNSMKKREKRKSIAIIRQKR